ncbi:MAG: Deoxycytidine triphosphate deaminase [Candidatus Daviesbacteria bacterium GW2011_GWA2_38_24]|uniref:Deoxycytidine triphosphate deaminase n=1 Tax=Candidatus Daviesbacteria bacterium GW2011_GWA2_38_24 TaxID=1618422 RepID=A0A0G0MM66_9BACT|nr:MAG: Deoxycytidine triphosphate deaminase [Candidatus Daviesbacteria bacterium GW2011_GWA2_38_24]KKQ80992.1 MAG: Deoxycytidine triphosphate deaminase [Candidatus Daviesbacteria bacterium GW2011_GWA1_38_7]OGE24410.1 MAG: dCTP deaminase [Candidatus Daviesbacteria bacterium RIFCSPHIGHO2_01_FULL_38_8]
MNKISDFEFLKYPGAVLSDRDIKSAIKSGFIEVKAPHKLNVQPASLDVHLAKTIMTISRRRSKEAAIDLKKPVDEFIEYEEIDPKRGTILHPREFILGVTTEWFRLPPQVIANVDGKSSLGRLGLVIHATAGFVDPGFKGHITLEITNLTEQPLVIYPNMPVGQVRFSVLTSPAENEYGSAILGSKKYPNDYDLSPKPIASQYWKNFK